MIANKDSDAAYKRYVENEKLVYFVSKKYRSLIDSLVNTVVDNDDINQLLRVTLWKCCNQYDESKGLAFSTYAYRALANALYMFKRDTKNDLTAMSINSILPKDSNDGNESTYEDIVKDAKDDYAHLDICDLLENALSNLSQRDKNIFLYYMYGYKQKEISAIVNVNQPSVSRIIKKVRNIIKSQL